MWGSQDTYLSHYLLFMYRRSIYTYNKMVNAMTTKLKNTYEGCVNVQDINECTASVSDNVVEENTFGKNVARNVRFCLTRILFYSMFTISISIIAIGWSFSIEVAAGGILLLAVSLILEYKWEIETDHY